MTTVMMDSVPAEPRRDEVRSGPAPTRTIVAYGFWIFLLSDFVLFSDLFAAYAVLSDHTAGGPSGAEIFNLRNVFIETICLFFEKLGGK